MQIKAGVRQDYQNWPRIKHKVSDLFLDRQNIRIQIDLKSPQQSLINDLFLNENSMQILESIALHGLFPDEIPVIIKENKKLIVIEGNRRVASLKALLRPELVPTKEKEIRDYLQLIGRPIKEIDVVVAPNRISVQRFLASKHTQNTRRPWRPLRQAYFYKAELERGKTVQDLRNEYPNVEIEKFLRLIHVHKIAKSLTYEDLQVAKKIHNERTFPASTIERLYLDKQVQNFLGFSFDKNGELKISIKKEEFEKGFKKIVQDVVNKFAADFGRVDSRTLNDEKNRSQYLASFSKEETPSQTNSKKLLTSKSFKEILPKKVTSKSKKLITTTIQYNLQSAGVRKMFVELQGINHRLFPNATHDLLRSFLECSLKAYFEETGKKIKPKKSKYIFLNDVLDEFIKEMNAANNHRLSQIASRIKSNNKMTSYSAKFLNATNHNQDVFVTPDEAKDAWDAMEPLFKYILNPIKQSDNENKL